MKALEKLYLNVSKSKISKIRLFLTLADTLKHGRIMLGQEKART